MNGRLIVFHVASDSMAPLIPSGCRVEVARAAEIRVGDVVCFYGPPIIIHRAVKRFWRVVVTKGDMSAAPDKPVGVDRVIGRVVAVVRRRGRIRIQSPPWIIVNAAIALVSLASYYSSRRSPLFGRAVALVRHAVYRSLSVILSKLYD